MLAETNINACVFENTTDCIPKKQLLKVRSGPQSVIQYLAGTELDLIVFFV
jgi:hypothetical protein